MIERRWRPMIIKGKKMQNFIDWINKWGDFHKHKECLDDIYVIGKDKRPNHITEYGRGYNQAISDVFDKIKPSYVIIKKKVKKE